MLKKLLKLEWNASARLLLLVNFGVLGLTALASALIAVQNAFPDVGSQTWFTIVTILIGIMMMMGFIGMMVVTVFLNVRSFYNLLGQRGYLLLTLPVTTTQHITAKLIYALATTLFSILMLFVDGCVTMVGMGETFTAFKDFQFISVGPMLYTLLLILLALAGGYLFLYLCIAIGGQWPQSRLFASVVTFFVLQFLFQILLAGIGIFAAFSFYRHGHLIVTMAGALPEPHYELYVFFGVIALIFLVWDAILWAGTQYLITKKLNLA